MPRVGSDRSEPDRVGISGAKPPRPHFSPMVCLRHPRHVVTSSRSRFVSRPLGSENWTLGTKLDRTSPWKETNFSPSCVICWVFLVLFFLKTAASQHCFSNTAFSTEMPKTAGLGMEEKRDCSTRSIHFSGVFFSSHILEHVSRLFITVFAFHCYRFMSMPNSVWGKWSFRNLNVFLFLVYFLMSLQHCLPGECVDFIFMSCVNMCFPPPTYRTIFLKSLISVFIHTFFSIFFFVKFGPCGLYSLHKLFYIVFYGEFYFRLRAWRLPL